MPKLPFDRRTSAALAAVIARAHDYAVLVVFPDRQ
jgi:hypothetical protein